MNLRTKTEIFPLQEQVNFAKSRPIRLVAVPALHHQVVDLFRADMRHVQVHLQPTVGTLIHPLVGVSHLLTIVLVMVGEILQQPFVGQILERLLPRKGQDLPEEDRKRPHVALAGVCALQLAQLLESRKL